LLDTRRFSFRVKVRLPLSKVKSSGRRAKRLMVSHCVDMGGQALYFRFDQGAHGGIGGHSYWRKLSLG